LNFEKLSNPQMHDDGFFDDAVAETYDRDHGGTDQELIQLTVETLHQLAFDETALEFAAGTGRIAIPLNERGVRVKGIELSKPMVAQLRKKKGGAALDIVIGDMTSTRIEGSFSLVFLVFNTIDNLTSQEAQIECFKNASAHLKPGGRFLIETQVPPIQKIPFGETKLAFARTTDHWGIDEFDIATQQYSSHHIWTENGSQSQLSVPFRYAWPAEMDLMAKLAGLELEHRWEDWQRKPFSRFSRSHISVWRKPA
jgi:SAM-dependent methyltransferase